MSQAESTDAKPTETVDIPSFNWKFVVLTRRPLVTPANLQSCNVPSRYIGAYYPNRSLTLFRDVLTFEKSSFPISLSFTNRKCADKTIIASEGSDEASVGDPVIEGDSTILAEESIDTEMSRPNSSSEGKGIAPTENTLSPELKPRHAGAATRSAIEKIRSTGLHTEEFGDLLNYRLTVSRKSDRRVIYDIVGQGGIHLYHIHADSFLQVGDEVPARSTEVDAPDAGGKGKKDDKKGKGGGSSIGDVVELLVELRLDDTTMYVPDEWRSRLPYSFATHLGGLDDPNPNAVQEFFNTDQEAKKAAVADGSKLDALPFHSIKPVLPQFLWQYDILTGTCASVSHDYDEVIKGNNLKKIWDDMVPGREVLARLAVDYFKQHIAFEKSNTEIRKNIDSGFVPTEDNAEAEEVKTTLYYDDKTVEYLEQSIWKKYPGTKDKLAIIYPSDKDGGAGSAGNTFKENYCGQGEPIEQVINSEVKQRKNMCKAEIQRLQKVAETGFTKMITFNDTMSDQTKQRINELIDSAYSAEVPPSPAVTSESDSAEAGNEEAKANPETDVPAHAKVTQEEPSTISGWWEKREKYRKDTDNLNESLRVLLDRSKEAIEATDPNADPKKKKK